VLVLHLSAGARHALQIAGATVHARSATDLAEAV
jgi:hypothetical protein